MTAFRQIVLLSVFAFLSSGTQVETQNPASKPTPSPSPMASPSPSRTKMPTLTPTPGPGHLETPTNMPLPSPMPVPERRGTSEQGSTTSAVPFPPPKDWPHPVEDRAPNMFVLADLFEFQLKGQDTDFRWDTEAWYGGDYNRVWFKSEGEHSVTKAERNLDFQILYARFVKRYYDFQVGARAETKTFRGASVTRGQLVIGIEGLVPYRYEFESALFVSHQGDVSGRLSFTREHLLNQKWIVQGRFETNFSLQRVERFGDGRGLNDVELGLRLRHEINREFAPYFGVSWDRQLFGTADFVRQEGANPSKLRFVIGVRLWR